MAHHELYTVLNPGAVKALSSAVRTGDATSAAVDLQGYDSALVLFNIGSSGDTLSSTVKLIPTITESDDDATYTTVAAADLAGAISLVDDPAEDDVIQIVAYRGSKRYIKVGYDFTGTHTNGTSCSATVLCGHKLYVNN